MELIKVFELMNTLKVTILLLANTSTHITLYFQAQSAWAEDAYHAMIANVTDFHAWNLLHQ